MKRASGSHASVAETCVGEIVSRRQRRGPGWQRRGSGRRDASGTNEKGDGIQ